MDVEVNPGPEFVGTDCKSKAKNSIDNNRQRKYIRRDLLRQNQLQQ